VFSVPLTCHFQLSTCNGWWFVCLLYIFLHYIEYSALTAVQYCFKGVISLQCFFSAFKKSFGFLTFLSIGNVCIIYHAQPNTTKDWSYSICQIAYWINPFLMQIQETPKILVKSKGDNAIGNGDEISYRNVRLICWRLLYNSCHNVYTMATFSERICVF